MVTIKDVAKLAGVGLGTASRVISGNGASSQAARERVEAAIRELDFRPSSVARALQQKSTGTIGVYVPDFRGPFYGPMLQAIDMELRTHGRHMTVAAGDGFSDAREPALEGARTLMARNCDGIVLATNALTDADLVALKRRMPALAVVNRAVKGLKANSFTVDHRRGGELAAQALLAHGHRRVVVVGGPAGSPDSQQRVDGFLDTFAAAGIDRAKIPIGPGDFTAESGRQAMRGLLEQSPRLTGVFCANDQMAMGVLNALRTAGLSVPADVSVVGYDDAELAAFLTPPLTTVHIAIDDMGRNACRLLLSLCYDLDVPVLRDFPPNLVLRESLARARR